MRAIERVHVAFERIGHPVDERSGMACCPAHDDDSASLSVGLGDDGKVLFRCFAGCQTADILQHAGLTWTDIFENDGTDFEPQADKRGFGGVRRSNSLPPVQGVPLPSTGTENAQPAAAPKAKKVKKPDRTKTTQPDIWYHYYDAEWRYVHSVMKWLPLPPDYPKKEFRQGVCRLRPDGTPVENRSMLRKWSLADVPRVMYRLPEMVEALTAAAQDESSDWVPPVIWVEGEKDVDALRDPALGEFAQVATTSSQGADGFKKLVESGGLAALEGCDVIVWPDNDEKNLVGYAYAAQLVGHLTEAGAHVVAVVGSAHGHKDAADHIEAMRAEGVPPEEMFEEPNLVTLARLGDTGSPTPLEWAETVDAQIVEAAEAKRQEAEQQKLGLVVPFPDGTPTPDHILADGDGGNGSGGGDEGGGGGSSMPPVPPMIQLNDRQPRMILGDLESAITNNNAPTPSVFQRAGQASYLHFDGERPRIAQFSKAAMQLHISKIADCVKVGKKGMSPEMVPGPIVEMLLSDPMPPWPHLELVTHMPLVTLTRDGVSVRTRRGYHEPARAWYEPLVDVPDVADEPSSEEVERATGMIEKLFGGFAFDDDESKANAIAMLFSPLLRSTIGSYTPMFVVRAPKQGSGKSTLANLVSLVHTGADMSPTPFTDNDEELGKGLAALMNAGDPIIVFDNMDRTLRSATLAGILTSGSLRQRRLGYNDQDIKVEDRAVWIATGNNLKVDTDFARRTATIVLNARESRPEFRDFAINDITGWALKNRAELIWSMLTLIAHWCAEGQPEPSYMEGSINTQYRRWIEVVGGIIETAEFANVGKLLANRGTVDSSNDEELEKERMLLGLWDCWQSESFTMSELHRVLRDSLDHRHDTLMDSMPQWLLEKLPGGKKSTENYFSSIDGAPHGEYEIMLVVHRDARRRVSYSVGFADPSIQPPPPPGATKSVLPTQSGGASSGSGGVDF